MHAFFDQRPGLDSDLAWTPTPHKPWSKLLIGGLYRDDMGSFTRLYIRSFDNGFNLLDVVPGAWRLLVYESKIVDGCKAGSRVAPPNCDEHMLLRSIGSQNRSVEQSLHASWLTFMDHHGHCRSLAPR